ncbi:MAG: glycosyltransferase family 4 protein [Candidatus Cloacimonas acidaminovorans]|jgi:glycosyltransferase involved in cell wall biosynthesis|nr:glycosyltransferase family 4 protein [Candidatus Cloacimonas acidaminovorans]
MNLYIIFPGALYPIEGMSQVRVRCQLERLSIDHKIVFSDMHSQKTNHNITSKELSQLNIIYNPIYLSGYKSGTIFRKLYFIVKLLKYHLFTITFEECRVKTRGVRKQIFSIVEQTNPDVFMIHYWYLGYIFKYLNPRILKLIDTHHLLEEKIALIDSYDLNIIQRRRQKLKLNYSLHRQREYFKLCNLIIVNSKAQETLIHNWNKNIPVIVAFNGQNLDSFLKYGNHSDSSAICFYGSLSNQFNRKALKRLLEQIFPIIKNIIPETKLYIIGISPPMDIINKFKDDSIIVTGYVTDIKPYLSRCKVMVLPLETGVGFRGRVVEAMALGIPVVGTSNALQSIELENGKQGFIEEDNNKIAEKVCLILNNNELFTEMSINCRKFAEANFSLESTFGNLSKTIKSLVAKVSN